MDEIGIEAARTQLGEIVNRAQYLSEETTITRHGKPVAVVVSAEWYKRVLAEMTLADLARETGKDQR